MHIVLAETHRGVVGTVFYLMANAAVASSMASCSCSGAVAAWSTVAAPSNTHILNLVLVAAGRELLRAATLSSRGGGHTGGPGTGSAHCSACCSVHKTGHA